MVVRKEGKELSSSDGRSAPGTKCIGNSYKAFVPVCQLESVGITALLMKLSHSNSKSSCRRSCSSDRTSKYNFVMFWYAPSHSLLLTLLLQHSSFP